MPIDAAADGASDAAVDAAAGEAGAPCVDDRFGAGSPELPAASFGFGAVDALVICPDEADYFASTRPSASPSASGWRRRGRCG
ncbi:MAG: hypothetical protein R3F60_25970 [bacterium]